MGINTAVVRSDHRHKLLTAGGHAAAAKDTLVVVPHEMGGGEIQLILRAEALVLLRHFHAVVAAHFLQFAVVGPHTGETFLVMGGEDQFQRRAAGGLYLRRVGLDLHPFGNRVHAGSHQTTGAGRFDHADTAGADLIDILQVAQGGDIDLRRLGGFENRGPLGNGIGSAVYFDVQSFHSTTILLS